jgi:DNA-binding CsgD family transcriptional regulator/PAS domain-containing protein
MSGPRKRLSEAELWSVVDGFYAAALDQAPWESALASVIELLDAELGVITVFETETGKLRQTIFHRADPRAASDVQAEDRAQDPRLRHLLRVGTGVPIYDYLHTPDDDEDESDGDPYYAWHARSAKTRHYIGGHAEIGDGLSAALSLHRARATGDVQPHDVEVWRTVLKHFERALRAAMRLTRGEGWRASSDAMLEDAPIGVVFLDAAGRPLHVNAAARRMAESMDGLAIDAAGISSLRRGDNALLQQAIDGALAESGSAADEVGDAVRIGRRTGAADYLVVVSRLPATERLFDICCPRAVVFIGDPLGRSGPDEERLRRLFGLTPAELRLAGRLVVGETLEEISRRTNVTLPTLRSQLAALFRKTGTSRQSELIRRLLSAPWQIGAR